MSDFNTEQHESAQVPSEQESSAPQPSEPVTVQPEQSQPSRIVAPESEKPTGPGEDGVTDTTGPEGASQEPEPAAEPVPQAVQYSGLLKSEQATDAESSEPDAASYDESDPQSVLNAISASFEGDRDQDAERTGPRLAAPEPNPQDGADIPDSEAIVCPACQYRFRSGDDVL